MSIMDKISKKHTKALGIFSKAQKELVEVLTETSEVISKNEEEIAKLTVECEQLTKVSVQVDMQLLEIQKIVGPNV
jgi:hypothetical protein